jgi:CRISPR-associated protein Cmr4
MYKKAYGVIETLAPLHVGATAGEESGNLNLIFRDQFTQTGIIPGSSIRGRFRSEMRSVPDEEQSENGVNYWYGTAADSEGSEHTTESVIKFEYASLLWLPVFCPGQPIVWVSSPKLLRRYQRIAEENLKFKNGTSLKEVKSLDNYLYKGSCKVESLSIDGKEKLFFNFGFVTIKEKIDLSPWFPNGEELPAIIVNDDEIGMIHDMALYRQSRVRLCENEKRVDKGGFFNVEALPEGTIMVFPIAIRSSSNGDWKPFKDSSEQSSEVYLGGLESIGFGNCRITIRNNDSNSNMQPSEPRKEIAA